MAASSNHANGAPARAGLPTARDLRFACKVWMARARLRALALAGRPPVVTYATYRTSSSAVHWALRRAVGGRAIKAHALLPGRLTMRESAEQSPVGDSGVPMNRHAGDWAVSREVVLPRRPARFVVMVRDPVAVAASSFAVGPDLLPPALRRIDWDAGPAPDARTVDALAAAIFDGPYPWRLMARWFDADARPALGWDVMATPFDRESGCAVTRHGPWDILLLRADVDDAAKSRALASFVGVPGIEVRRENSAASRGRGGLADAVRRAIATRPREVDELLDSPVARHFWTDAQRGAMRQRWLG